MKNCFYKFVFVLGLVVSFFNHSEAQVSANVNAHNTNCGLNNGTAMVYPQNGTGYTYQWSSGGSTTDTATGFAPGNYSVTVYNGAPNHADSIVKTFTIGASAPVTITVSAAHDTICTGSSEWLHASGGTAGGTYTWSGGTLTSPQTGDSIQISTIFDGLYTYTVTWGTNACANTTFALHSYTISANLSKNVQPSCGGNNGTLDYGVLAGNGFTTTLLKNGIAIEHGSQTKWDSVLGPGSYVFILTDPVTGCTDTLPAQILLDNSVHPTFDNIAITPASCFGANDGSIFVTLGNCSGGCSYAWSQSTTDHTDSAVHLAAGTYVFSVTGGGCTNLDTTIIVPGPTTALKDSLKVTADHCSHLVGTAVVHTTGGTGPYSYTWSMSPSTQDSIYGLPGDTTVKVRITDSHGCIDSLSGFISNTSGPRAVMNKPDTICYRDSIGILIVTPTGISPFTYLWSNGQTTNVDAGLFAGPYTVTVTDAVGCDTVLHDTIPAYLPFLHPVATPAATVSAGTQVEIELQTNVPYTDVVWSPYIPGSRGSTIVSVQPDTTTSYSVTMSYGHSCTIIDTIQIGIVTDSSKFTIPNTFTPNGDGINDFFKLLTSPDLSSFHIWIYDRWGNKMFESTDADFRWDGNDQYDGNKPTNTGVFSYVIQYTDTSTGKKGTIGGNISLVK